MLGPLDLAKRRSAATPVYALPAGAGSLEAFADRKGIRDVLRFFARERRWIDEQHLTFCRIPAPTFFEQNRAAWFASQFQALGWNSAVDRAGNVTAQRPSAAKDGPLLAVTAHLDTVLTPRTPEDVTIDGRGRFLGPGVADNGVGLAALLAFAHAIQQHAEDLPLANRLLLVANVGEEGEGNLSGMKFLCRQSPYAGRLHSILILDGPDTAHITADALACRRFEITVSGPGGHSWSDHGAANPIHAAARAITWYTDARAQEPPRARPCSWNFGVIEGGSTVNAIPASVRVKVDLRSESTAELDDLSHQLAIILEKAILAENEQSRAGRVSAKLRETGSRPGGQLPPGAAILQYVLAVDQHLGIRAHRDCASTDANVPLSMSIPALSLGAGGHGGGAHTPNEWYVPEGRDLGLRRAFLVLALLLEDLATL